MVKKIKIYNDFKINRNDKSSIILIGNFDGLHSGHQKLFNQAKKYKKKLNLKLGVITFDPIPKMFFNKNIKNYRISNFDQKVSYFKKFGVDFLVNKNFNKKFSKITYQKFIEKILYKKLNAKYIFVSNNFRFGYKREGNVNLLKSYQKKYKYKIVNPKPLKKKYKLISSTLIRKLISKGEINVVNNYLGRNWSVEGIVKRGRKIGRRIGFPTCNINLKDYIVPKFGVYAVNVSINQYKKLYKGIANVGFRPTFKQNKLLLEVNIFNFSGNLYNKKLRVDFKKFIRKEKKFKGIDQLKKQISIDVRLAKKIT